MDDGSKTELTGVNDSFKQICSESLATGFRKTDYAVVAFAKATPECVSR
jgi:hypothetical protein